MSLSSPRTTARGSGISGSWNGRHAINATDDVVRNEERSYLLMYLREFAGPDGILPADFDGLVRDAFGDVLHTVGA